MGHNDDNTAYDAAVNTRTNAQSVNMRSAANAPDNRIHERAGCIQARARRPKLRRQTSFALRQAKSTSQALASIVIVGSRPGRGRSSSAASGPSATARSTQRWTVW